MRKWIVVICALGLAHAVMAADELQFGPVPSWVRPNSPSPTGERTEAASKFLLSDYQLNFDPAGDESFAESYVYVQTPQGLANHGTVILRWKPDSDVVTVHKLHILRGDQLIDVLAAGQAFKVMQRENNLEFAVLDGMLTAALQIEGLQVGDIVNLAYTLKRSDSVLAGISEQLLDVWPVATISRVRIRVRWNKANTIRWRASPALSGIRESREGDSIVVALTLDDEAPQQFPKGAPIRYRFNRQIEFTGSKSWADVSKRLAPLYTKAAALAPGSLLNQEIDRFRAASADPRVRAAMALSLVQDHVRYVYLGMNDGGLVPATADDTWTRRFGDCKGKTALLLAILRGLGIKAEAVAVSSNYGDGLSARLPMVGLFDHVLVRATIDGKSYWLDGTRTGDRRLEDVIAPGFRWGLPLAANAGELVPIEVAPLTRPLSETELRIDATNGVLAPAPLRAETVFRGDLATQFKLQLANLSTGERERGLREYWSAVYDFVSIDSVATRFDEQTGEQRITMEGKASLRWSTGWYYVDGLALGYNADFSRSAQQDQDAPFMVAFPIFTRTRTTILLPKSATKFSTHGDDVRRTAAGMEYVRKIRIENDVFVGEASARSIAAEFPASQAKSAEESLRELKKTTAYLKFPYDYRWTDADLAAQRGKSYDSTYDLVSRGVALLRRDDYDGAIADFDQAISLDAKAELALANRGLAHVYKRNYEAASKDLDAAFALNPSNVAVYRARGVMAVAKRDAGAAIAEFTAALQLEPGDTFSLSQRARAYLGAGDQERALADSEQVIRATPNDIGTYSLRFAILRRQGKPEQASREIDQMLAANPNEQRAHLAAGAAYKSFGKDAEAAREFDRAVAIAPNEAAYLARAAYRPVKDHEGRLADVDAVLKINPRSVEALTMRASVQIAAEQYDKAVESYSAAIEIRGDQYYLLTARGIARAKQGRNTEAQADFAAARVQAKGAGELNNICWSIATANVSLQTALSLCDEAVAKSPSQAGFIDSRAFVLLRMGRIQEAIAAYDQALGIQPKLAASLYGRGIAKRRNGEDAAGERDTQAALSVDPNIDEQFTSYGVTL